MHVRAGVLAAAVTLCAVANAAAQSDLSPLASRPISISGPAPAVLSPGEQLIALQRWTRDYQAWRAWQQQWRNRPEPGWWTVRERRQPPVPPAWLPSLCVATLEEEGPTADACRALHEWSIDDSSLVLTQQIAQARADIETPLKSKWWERLHVDGLWPMTRAGSSAFGVAGMHTTLHVTKRFQVFLAPGFILMRLPALDGTPTWSAATDWGFSYGLFDFKVPGTRRPATMHLNIARVWVLGQSSLATTGEIYVAGFSLSFKQR